jgi:cyclopropane fatty-acyl-phospholipid synthase-like methyltransferase
VLDQDALLGLEQRVDLADDAALSSVVRTPRTTIGARSRANTIAYCDLGNKFYRLFLEETLMYSDAIFPTLDVEL